MKNVFIVLLIGCLILMMWSYPDQEQQSTNVSKKENTTQNDQMPRQKSLSKDVVQVEKKSKEISRSVSKSIRPHKRVLEEEEGVIVPLERPDDMVYPPTREGINDVMVQFLPNIADCYNQALESNPDMGGRLMASFRIEKPKEEESEQDLARISEVEILDSDIDHEHFENCIMDNIDEFWFEPPPGEHIDVQYPFVFSTK